MAATTALAATGLPTPLLSALDRYPIPPASDAIWVRLQRCEDGTFAAQGFNAFRAEAIDDLLHRKDAKVERLPFEPIDQPDRFVVAELEWEIPHIGHLGLCPYSSMTKHEQKAYWDLWGDARELIRLPESLVDVLHGISGMFDWYNDQEAPVTRAAALEEAARLNAAIVAEEPIEPGIRWNVAVELGQAVLQPIYEVSLQANGIGEFSLSQGQPVRLVRPTGAELAAYPLTAAVELAGKAGAP